MTNDAKNTSYDIPDQSVETAKLPNKNCTVVAKTMLSIATQVEHIRDVYSRGRPVNVSTFPSQ